MTAEVAHVVAEKTRQVANLVKEGKFTLAVAHLVETARTDDAIYQEVTKNLKSYIYQGDIDDLLATVEMVK